MGGVGCVYEKAAGMILVVRELDCGGGYVSPNRRECYTTKHTYAQCTQRSTNKMGNLRKMRHCIADCGY